MEQLNLKVSDYISEHGLTQEEFAKLVGVSQATISSVTRGATPSDQTLMMIKRVLEHKSEDSIAIFIPTIINLFNEGKLSITTANWFRALGYAIICSNSEVIDIRKEA